jgi:Fur family peroxide stress response transcriptional regulator
MTVVHNAAADPARLLREAGLRVTPQRLAVAQAALLGQHPTAGEIFEAVHKQFPTIGLATVYATLNTMSRRGLLAPVAFADAVRYDANVTPHANLICVVCGSITDFDGCQDVLAELRERTATSTGFSCAAERLDLHGTCAACQSELTPKS